MDVTEHCITLLAHGRFIIKVFDDTMRSKGDEINANGKFIMKEVDSQCHGDKRSHLCISLNRFTPSNRSFLLKCFQP